MNKHFVFNVFSALVEHVATKGESPTVRELCAAVGWNGEKEVWLALQVLEDIGVIRWPHGFRGRRADRGIELLTKLKSPTIIPIVGYLGAPADFVPGTRWVEIHENGRIVVVEGEKEWEGTIVSSQ